MRRCSTEHSPAALNQPVRLGWFLRACRVRQSLGGTGQYLIDDTPALLYRVGPLKQRRVTLHDIEEQRLVTDVWRFIKRVEVKARDSLCKLHLCPGLLDVESDLDGLVGAGASFMPSVGAVNSTLTIIANALRVAEKIAGRLTGLTARSVIDGMPSFDLMKE